MSGFQPWTDNERGFLQDHDDWTADQIADALGRSAASVRMQRWQLRSGWVPQAEKGRPWTKTEDAFLLANPRMSGPDIAAHLGRSDVSVRKRRAALGVKGGGNWSPFNIGSRPLLAKTCPKCGLLLQAQWFGPRTRSCNRCADRSNMKKPDKETQRRHGRKAYAKYQAMTRPGASNIGQPWTEADMKILGDPDMTLLEKAFALHRTYTGVVTACRANGFSSKVGIGDPERDQWIIDNPNYDRLEEIQSAMEAAS